jgi:DNA-binding NarL/FixJ family response regulator
MEARPSHGNFYGAGVNDLIKAALTPRESDVANLVLEGLHDKEIAQELDICASTVRKYMKFIFLKCGVRNRVQLALQLSSEKFPRDSFTVTEKGAGPPKVLAPSKF